MKKFLFSTMIASLLAFVGCQNEELVNENTNNDGEKVILTANIQGAADSRVALTPATENGDPIVKVAWNESGETFEVYGSSGASSTFTQIAGTNQFEGTLPESADGEYEAYYGNPNSLDEQDGKLGQSTANDTPVLMSAMFNSSSPSITFEHVTAILKPTFKVNGEAINNTITKIVMGGVAKGNSGNGYYLDEITIPPTSPTTAMDDDIYIHLLVFPQVYTAGHEFTFSVTADGKNYTGSLTIPEDMSIVAGNLYTATIALTEVEKVCNLPNSEDDNIFTDALVGFLLDNEGLTSIKFIANSETTSGTQIGTCGAYMIVNGTTLEIHTSASKYVFPVDCSSMFNGSYLADDDSMPLQRIISIDFNDCIDTSNVTSMSNMFRNMSALTALDLKCFDTSNVTNMFMMFAYCSKLESLDLTTFNVENVTNFSDMLWMMANLGGGNKTKVYVSNPNPFEGKNTGINTNIQGNPADPEYAEFVVKQIPYVTFTASAAQTLKYGGTDLQYSTDKETWTALPANTEISFGGGTTLYLRGSENYDGTGSRRISFGNSTKVACTGDIRTLIDWSTYDSVETSSAKFSYLFHSCSALTSAPALPAKNLVSMCYMYMFYKCTSLTTAPELPATTLSTYCYSNMFNGCTSLTTAPELSATTLTNFCYSQMFKDCSELSSITMLATDISAGNCLNNWVVGVAERGSFTKAANMNLPHGESGIPMDWTVHE